MVDISTVCLSAIPHALIFPAACPSLRRPGFFALTGCATWHAARQHQSSSIVQFLYPDKDPARGSGRPSPPCKLPLRVGVELGPRAESKYGYYGSDFFAARGKKTALLQQITAEFKSLTLCRTSRLCPRPICVQAAVSENLDHTARHAGHGHEAHDRRKRGACRAARRSIAVGSPGPLAERGCASAPRGTGFCARSWARRIALAAPAARSFCGN